MKDAKYLLVSAEVRYWEDALQLRLMSGSHIRLLTHNTGVKR